MAYDKGESLANVISESVLNDKSWDNLGLERTIQTRIGDQLRAMYDDLMEQPVPNRFTEFLARLDNN